jgi:hypothetical protein
VELLFEHIDDTTNVLENRLNNMDHRPICNLIKEYDQETRGFSNLDTRRVKGCHVQRSLFHRVHVYTHFFPDFPPPFMASISLFLHKLDEDNKCLK